MFLTFLKLILIRFKKKRHKIEVQEGWDGIKSGYVKKPLQQQQQQLSLNDQSDNNGNESKKRCC